MSKECLHDLFFSLQKQYYSKGQVIIRPGDNADNLMIVANGAIEVYTEFEGNKFIIDHLGPGSIINYRSFFMSDLMHVFMECLTDVTVLIAT